MEIHLRTRRAPALQAHGRQLWACRTAERLRIAGLALICLVAVAMLSFPAGLCEHRLRQAAIASVVVPTPGVTPLDAP